MSRLTRLLAFTLTSLLGLAGYDALGGPVVRINELQSSNGETLRDENGDSPDWLELFNAGDAPADLTGWALSDDPGRPFKWRFEGGVLAPGEYLLVYASGKDRQPAHTSPLPPSDVPGLVLWLRADAISAGDSSQLRSTGTARVVRRWNDQSDRLGPAIQNTPNSQPEWRTNVVHGLPAVVFDGSDDALHLDRPAGTNDFTIFAVARPNASHEVESESTAGVGGTAGQRWLLGASHGGDFNGGAGVSLGINGASVYEHGSGYMPALAVAPVDLDDGFTLATVRYSGRRPALFLNGSLARDGLTSPRSAVTAPVEIGSGAYGAFSGAVAEILLFNRALTDEERRGIESGLSTKYDRPLDEWWHTGFQLSAEGESLRLSRPDGTVADEVAFGPVPRDVSFGRPAGEPALLRFFSEPTPGRANTTPASLEFLAPPLFSSRGGFFTNEFSLTLTASSTGARIHYTLDGSDPDESSSLYAGPIPIRSRAGTPNGISNLPTTPGGPVPSGEVFKGWVVRARTFKDGALPSAEAVRSFFVSPAGRKRYSVPVVSLVTAADHFFDADRGIYVPGNQGNYSQRGPEWERPAFVELFETDDTVLVAQPVGVKIHGNTSQNFPVKGLDLDATAFEGRRPFIARLFPDRDRTEYEHVLLRPTGHDQLYAFQRDELMQSLVEPLGVETQAARLVVLFINGEYWGLHYLKDKEDADFVAHAAGEPVEELDYLEGYTAPRAGDLVRWNELMDFLATRDLSQATNYAWVTGVLDPVNYALYKAAESFTYRWDIGNHRFWRPRTPDGRFRWLQFDNDVGWGGFWAEQPAWNFDMLAHQLEPTGGLHGHSGAETTRLFGSLMRSPEFRRLFLNVYADLLNSVYQPTNTIARIEAFTAALAPEMAEHIRRWRTPSSVTEWQGHVSYLKQFARLRPEAVRQQLESRFKPSGPAPLTLSVNHPDGGSIRTTLLNITNAPDQRWTGTYFRFNPLPLEAVARPGWRFAGWREIPGASAALTLAMTAEVTLTAEFVPEPVTISVVKVLPDGHLRLSGSAPPGITHSLETGVNLDGWKTIRTIEPDSSGAWTIDVAVPPERTGWWRLKR